MAADAASHTSSGLLWLIPIAGIIAAGAAVLYRSNSPTIVTQPYVAEAIYDVEILQRRGHPAVVTTGQHGENVRIACSTCHSTRDPQSGTVALDRFHQGLRFTHGTLACASCHDDRSNYDTLKLADGTTLAFDQAQTLCSQCHGPQARDYAAGAHGGMMGHWDLSKGGRTRHTCTTCHDPHSPTYPTLIPAPGPNDRFLDVHEVHHE